MNRKPLNSIPVGMGAPNNLVRILITRINQQVGTLRSVLIKHGAATQEHLQVGITSAIRWSCLRMAGLQEQTSSLSNRIQRKVSLAWAGCAALVTTVLGRKLIPLQATQVQEHNALLVPTVQTLLWQEITQELLLVPQVTGHDFNTEIAPVTRRSHLPASPRRIAVSGASNNVGV